MFMNYEHFNQRNAALYSDLPALKKTRLFIILYKKSFIIFKL